MYSVIRLEHTENDEASICQVPCCTDNFLAPLHNWGVFGDGLDGARDVGCTDLEVLRDNEKIDGGSTVKQRRLEGCHVDDGLV